MSCCCYCMARCVLPCIRIIHLKIFILWAILERVTLTGGLQIQYYGPRVGYVNYQNLKGAFPKRPVLTPWDWLDCAAGVTKDPESQKRIKKHPGVGKPFTKCHVKNFCFLSCICELGRFFAHAWITCSFFLLPPPFFFYSRIRSKVAKMKKSWLCWVMSWGTGNLATRLKTSSSARWAESTKEIPMGFAWVCLYWHAASFL